MGASLGFRVDLGSKKLDWFHNYVHSSLVLFFQSIFSFPQYMKIVLF